MSCLVALPDEKQVSRSQGLNWFTHLRLVMFLGFLAAVDAAFIAVLFLSSSGAPSVLMLFAFEVIIMIVTSCTFPCLLYLCSLYRNLLRFFALQYIYMFLQFLILSVIIVSTALKYVLVSIDNRMQGRWANKSSYLFYLEFLTELTRLFLYLVFFMVVTA